MQEKEPTLDQVIHARNECANIIALYGEKYIPIFERLEEELEIRQKRMKLLRRALAISDKTGTQIGTQTGTQLSPIFYKHS
jgi:pantoate kinase